MTDDEGDDEHEWSEEQIIEFLVRLRDGAARQQQVRAMHPGAVMMAEPLRIHAGLLEATLEIRHLERLREISQESEPLYDQEEMRWHPADNFPAAQESAWASAQAVEWDEDPVLEGVRIVQGVTAAAIDHLRGTAVLMRATDLVRSPIAAALSALEAFATLAFVLDPDLAPLERLRRVGNMRLMQLEEERRGSEGDSERDVADRIARLLANCEALGLEPTKESRKKPGGRNFPGLINRESVQAMIEALLEGVGEDLYRSMSALAHSREATTLLLSDSLGDNADVPMRSYDVARHVIGAVLAVVEVVPRLDAYLGWDLTEVSDGDETLLTVWGTGAGLYDDAIRKHLFGDPDDTSPS